MIQYVIRQSLQLLTPLFVFMAAWQVLAWVVHAFRHVPFPTPVTVVISLIGLVLGDPLSDHAITTHLRGSLLRWGTGFLISVVLGIAYGLAAGWLRKAEQATTVFMITMTALPPIALNVMAGVKHLDPHLIRAARMLGAEGPTMLFLVLLPGVLPAILTGLRIGMGTGWRVLAAAEIFPCNRLPSDPKTARRAVHRAWICGRFSFQGLCGHE